MTGRHSTVIHVCVCVWGGIIADLKAAIIHWRLDILKSQLWGGADRFIKKKVHFIPGQAEVLVDLYIRHQKVHKFYPLKNFLTENVVPVYWLYFQTLYMV